MVLEHPLPTHGPSIDDEVCQREEETMTWGPLSLMSWAELIVLKKWLQENRSKRFIRQLSSPLQYDFYLQANQMWDCGSAWIIGTSETKQYTTITPFPWRGNCCICFEGCRYIQSGMFEQCILCCKLSCVINVSWLSGRGMAYFTLRLGSLGQHMHLRITNGYSNNIIREALDDFASAYLDDILIYSNWKEEHEEHGKWIMKRLVEAGLCLKPEKCELHKETVRYLGLIISMEGLWMDEDMIDTVRNLRCEKKRDNGRLINMCDIEWFPGVSTCYWHFISKYSKNA